MLLNAFSRITSKTFQTLTNRTHVKIIDHSQMLLMFNQISVDESAHLESSQTSKVELFVNNSQQFSAFNYFLFSLKKVRIYNNFVSFSSSKRVFPHNKAIS